MLTTDLKELGLFLPNWSVSLYGYTCVQSLSHVRLFSTPWTVAHQAPLSMGLSRQEYWSGLPFPSREMTKLCHHCCFPILPWVTYLSLLTILLSTYHHCSHYIDEETRA